jgi:hypothetical protein
LAGSAPGHPLEGECNLKPLNSTVAPKPKVTCSVLMVDDVFPEEEEEEEALNHGFPPLLLTFFAVKFSSYEVEDKKVVPLLSESQANHTCSTCTYIYICVCVYYTCSFVGELAIVMRKKKGGKEKSMRVCVIAFLIFYISLHPHCFGKVS